jgi:hypothetical protein
VELYIGFRVRPVNLFHLIYVRKDVMKTSHQKSAVIGTTLIMMALVWSTVAPVRAQGLRQSEDGEEVVDANGVSVGDVYVGKELGDTRAIYQFREIIFEVNIDRQGFRGEEVLFTTANCTGTKFMPPHQDRLKVAAAISPPGQSVYVPNNLDAPGATRTIRSRRGRGACEPLASGSPMVVVPARRLVNLLNRFTPPFALRFIFD